VVSPDPSLGAVPPRPNNWLYRNRKWFIPVLVAISLVMTCAFVAGLLTFINSMFVKSYPYQVALERAKESPQVSDLIGTPLKVGRFTTGNLRYAGPNGEAALNIPISGPKGHGTIVVVATERARVWKFDRLEVYVAGQDQPIPLLEPEAPPGGSTPANSTSST